MEHQIVDLEEVLCIARNDGYRGQIVLISGEPKTGKTETLAKIIAAVPMRNYWYSYHVRCDIADRREPLPRGRHGIFFLDDAMYLDIASDAARESARRYVDTSGAGLCCTIFATDHLPRSPAPLRGWSGVAHTVLRTRVGEPGKYDLVKRPYADQAEAPLG